MWNGHLGTIKATAHRIKLMEDAKPSFLPPYRAGLTQREPKKKELNLMLKVEVIEPSISQWAAPVVCATETCGTLRFLLLTGA